MMGDGLLLVNRQLVLSQILELAKLKICGILKVQPGAVQVYCEKGEDGKLHPCIDIIPEALEGVTPVQTREVIGTIYDRLKIDLRVRFSTLQFKRAAYHPDEDDADDEATSITT